jgi:hypothetical protein
MANLKTKEEILNKYGSERLEKHKVSCESFFEVSPFNSEKDLTELINGMSLQEFTDWQYNLISDYRDNYQIIVDLVALIRTGLGQKLNDENDPARDPDYQQLIKKYRDVCESVFEAKYGGVQCVREKSKQCAEERRKLEQERMMTINVNGKKFKAIDICEVLWAGWECDSSIWVVVDEGISKLVTTDHGEAHFTEPSFLEEKISEYEKAIEDSRRLIELVRIKNV